MNKYMIKEKVGDPFYGRKVTCVVPCLLPLSSLTHSTLPPFAVHHQHSTNQPTNSTFFPFAQHNTPVATATHGVVQLHTPTSAPPMVEVNVVRTMGYPRPSEYGADSSYALLVVKGSCFDVVRGEVWRCVFCVCDGA